MSNVDRPNERSTLDNPARVAQESAGSRPGGRYRALENRRSERTCRVRAFADLAPRAAVAKPALGAGVGQVPVRGPAGTPAGGVGGEPVRDREGTGPRVRGVRAPRAVGERVPVVLARLPPRASAVPVVLEVRHGHRVIMRIQPDADALPVALVVEHVGRPGGVVESVEEPVGDVVPRRVRVVDRDAGSPPTVAPPMASVVISTAPATALRILRNLPFVVFRRLDEHSDVTDIPPVWSLPVVRPSPAPRPARGPPGRRGVGPARPESG